MSRPADLPTLSLSELYAPIAADLERCRRVLADELISDQGFISDLCGHVRQFHGKMLRPALLLLTAKACGGVRPEHPVLAAVVELVHIATLVHDDVLDEADIRRRAATVNRLWGNERAVMMGDFLFSHAYHLCSSLQSQYAARLIGRTACTVCEGEMMQIASRENWELTEPEYDDIILRKTAVLVGACCELGAHYCDAAPATVTVLRQFGELVGQAFQIIDDILDIVGDESETGKSIGRDVQKGKLTLPLIHALRTTDAETRSTILTHLRGADPQRHRHVAALVNRGESVEYAQNVAADHVTRAKSLLNCLPSSPARESLEIMADFVLARRQ